MHKISDSVQPTKVTQSQDQPFSKELPWNNHPKAVDKTSQVHQEVAPPFKKNNASLDPKESVASLIAEHKVVDKTAKVKEHSLAGTEKTDIKEKPSARHELPNKVKVVFEEETPNDPKHPKREPDFVIKTIDHKTHIEVHNDPEKNPHPDGQIVISLERGSNQLNPTSDETAKVGELLSYLRGRQHTLHPEAPSQKIEVEDNKGVASPNVLKQVAYEQPTQYSQETKHQVQQANRFEGGTGTLSHGQLDSYFPQREVKPQQNESPDVQAVKNAYINLVHPDKQNAYETVHQANDGSYVVGVGLNYNLITSWWLQAIGVPPDLKKIDELAKEGLISPELAKKMHDPKFQKSFAEFMMKLKGGHGAVTANELKEYLPKELQETMLSSMVETYAQKDPNPGKIALSLMLGKSPDKLTPEEIKSNQQYEDAATRLFILAKAKQSDTTGQGVTWDGTGLKTASQPTTKFEADLAHKALEIARVTGTTGHCAGFVQQALKAVGQNFMGAGDGWGMLGPLVESGKWVPFDPTKEPLHPGCIVVQRWAPDVVAQNNGHKYGDIFVVGNVDSNGQVTEANDHTQIFDPNYKRYDKRVYLKPVAVV